MSGRLIAGKVQHTVRGLTAETTYNKHMNRLSNHIFNEPVAPVDRRALRAVTVMSSLPYEQDPQKRTDYFPNLPMFHYLTKMLRLHGLFFDEHVVWRQLQDGLKIMRGKVINPPPGEGKRAQLRSKLKS